VTTTSLKVDIIPALIVEEVIYFIITLVELLQLCYSNL